MKQMKKLKEKLKAIRHIITDGEYAVYTITVKDGKVIRNRICCLISDNASELFIDCIIKFTEKYKNGSK